MKVLLASLFASDTTGYLRNWGPFTHDTMKKANIEPIRPPLGTDWLYDWSYYWQFDLIYLIRPSTAREYMLIGRAKQLGVPVWVDFDDDLLSIPDTNPYYHQYTTSDAIKIMSEACLEADILTTHSERHAQNLRLKFQREVTVIPNAIDDRLLALKKPWKRSKKIAWRGSSTHAHDLLSVQSGISQMHAKYNTHDWHYFGCDPLFINKSTCPYTVSPTMNLMDYHIALAQRNSSYHWCALADSEFNRVKSAISWFEATLAGSVFLGPNLDEFRKPGIMQYECGMGKDFSRMFTDMLQLSDFECDAHVKTSWEYIKDNFLTSKTNEKRLEILRNV